MRKILLIALVLAMLAGMDALAEAALEVTEAALQEGGPVLVGLIDYPINAESAPGITVRQDLSGWFADYLPRAKSYETFWISAYLDDKRIFLEPLAHLK